MEENTNVLVDEEFGVDLSDLFPEEGGDNQIAEPTEETPETEPTEPPAPAEDKPAEGEQNDNKPAEEEFELKFNKETRKVGRQEAIELAQKGLNHDRMQQQRDQLRTERDELAKYKADNGGLLDLLGAVAQQSNMQPVDFLNAMRENLLVSKGMSRETAKERIAREDAEKKIKSEAAAQQQRQDRENAEKQRRERDIQDFLRIYGKVDAKSIPQEVWKEANETGSLVAAYGRYQNQQLQKQIKDLETKLAAKDKNEENRRKTVGSMKSDGNGEQDDDFLSGFMSV